MSRFSNALYRAQQRAGLTGPEARAAVVLVLALACGVAAREAVRHDAPTAPDFYAAADAAFVAASQRPAPPAPTPAPDSTALRPAARPAPGAAPTAPTTAGPVPVNTATVAELLALPGVGSVTAARLVEARPFRDAADLQRVRGIGPAKAARLAPFVRF